MDGAFTRVALSTGGATIPAMSEVEAVALCREERQVGTNIIGPWFVGSSDTGCLALVLGEVRRIYVLQVQFLLQIAYVWLSYTDHANPIRSLWSYDSNSNWEDLYSAIGKYRLPQNVN
jgi:hypothetical protein